MKLTQLFPPCGGADFSGYDINIVTSNARRCRPGSLFAVIENTQYGGRRYAMTAYENGCRAFLSEEPLELPPDAAVVIARDALDASCKACKRLYGNSSRELTVIGICGTCGKTSCAMLLLSVLKKHGGCAYMSANGLVTDAGRTYTPEYPPERADYERFFKECAISGVRYVIIEISPETQRKKAISGMKFDCVAVTGLSAEKAVSYFNGISAKGIVYNADCPVCLSRFSGRDDVCAFGIDEECEYRGGALAAFIGGGKLGMEFDCVHNKQRTHAAVLSPGEFSVYNALCAVAIAGQFGISAGECAEVMKTAPVRGRFETVFGFDDRVFMIDRAHTGEGLSAALSLLRGYSPKRLICVFGAEGKCSDEEIDALGTAAALGADFSIVTSDNTGFFAFSSISGRLCARFENKDSLLVIENRSEAVRFAVQVSAPGDIILFAGKGLENFQLFCGIRHPFCERDIIMGEAARLIKKEANDKHYQKKTSKKRAKRETVPLAR